MDGTKTEMVRLINDSGILNKKIKDLDKVTFDQMILAIHKVQDNLGITGTTAKEASETIQGSISSMKSSWQNLLTGIANSDVDTKPLLDNFIESVKTVGKNLIPVIKTTISGLVDTARELLNELMGEKAFSFKGETVLRKMQESFKKLINTLEWFHKNKNLVSNSIKLMIAAFAVAKINQWTKSLSGVTKGFITLIMNAKQATVATQANTAAQTANTTAQVAGTGATGALTVATKALNAAWKANPIGLIITGVTTLITLYQLFKSKTDENTQAQKKETEEMENQTARINENKEAWDELKESKQNQIDVGMTEITHYKSLYDELSKIVDANGRVKDGYQERASFIVSTLNEALGTEIKITNGVVQKYGDLKNTIDEVIQKKKAQIILDTQEEMYTEALKNRTQATKELASIEQQLNEKKHERKGIESELAEAQEKYNEKVQKFGEDAALGEELQIKSIQARMNKLDEETSNIQNNYDTQKNIISEYAYNIGLYESNMAAAHAGKYDEMSTVTWDSVKDYQNAGDAEKKMLEEQIASTSANLEILKELRSQNGGEIYEQQVIDGERQLAELEKQMSQYVVVTEEELNKVQLTWSENLDNQLSEITGKNVEFREDGKGNVQMYVDGIASGEATSKEKMADIAKKTILEISKQKTGATTAGEDLIEGINNGVGNERKQSGVFSTIASFGTRLLEKFRTSLQEHSPSKATEEDGINLLLGLSGGIKKKENTVINQLKKFGQSVVKTLNNELNTDVNTNFIDSLNNARSGLTSSNSILRNNSAFGNVQSNSNNISKSNVNNFTQIINAPKQPSRIELYRQTKNLLEIAKGVN